MPPGSNACNFAISPDRSSAPAQGIGCYWGSAGKFGVTNAGAWVPDTGFKCETGRWHKIAMRIDVPKQTFEFFVDDKRFESAQPLKFGEKVAYLSYFNFIVTGGVYIDALRVTRLPDDASKDDLIASSGFNDARGINSNPVPGSPFPLGIPNREGGVGEPGWAGPWAAHPDAVFQSKVVFEGDGALHLKGRPNFGPNYGRQLAQPQTGRFQLEYRLQMPAGSNCGFGIGQDPSTKGGAGCHWSREGKLSITDAGGWVPDTGFKCEPGRWHKIAMQIDVPRQTYEFFFDDQHFESAEPLKFGAKLTHLSYINIRVEGEAYIDALRVTRLPDAPAVAPRPAKPLPPDHIASTGFNHAKGLHSDLEKAPFPLDASDRAGGYGEPGWAGPWPAHPKATFQSKVVFEGDAALYLEGSPNFGPNYGRQLAKAQTGKFQVEHHVQVPGGSSFGAYVWQHPRGADVSGPTWGARNGKFYVHAQETDVKCVPGQWYKVTLRIDVASHTWEFFVDGKRFASTQPLKFRGKVEYLDYINFLVEGGVYIDDLRVTRLPDAGWKE